MTGFVLTDRVPNSLGAVPASLLEYPMKPSGDSILGLSTAATGGGRYLLQRAPTPASLRELCVFGGESPGQGPRLHYATVPLGLAFRGRA